MPNRLRSRIALAATLVAGALTTAPAAVSAQDQVVDYSTAGVSTDRAVIPAAYGSSFLNVGITFAGLTGWGAAPSTGAVFRYWTTDYADLKGVGYFDVVPTTPTYSVGQMSFDPAAGKQVTIRGADVAGYPGRSNNRRMQLRVYDWSYANELYRSPVLTHFGTVAGLTITSDVGLHLQWSEVSATTEQPAGVRAFDTAVDNVRFSISDVTTTTTPEPSTAVLLAGGLAAVGAAARRRTRRS